MYIAKVMVPLATSPQFQYARFNACKCAESVIYSEKGFGRKERLQNSN